MKNLLAIETSGASCSVALEMDGNRISACEHVQKRHNEVLLPMLSDLCERAGLDSAALCQRLDALAFGCGPGSFTGVRIAAAAAQAIALASGARIVRVSSSEALAHRCAGALIEPPAGVITLIRSRRDLYYLAEYAYSDGRLRRIAADRLLAAAPDPAWYAARSGWVAAGELPGWWAGDEVLAVAADAVDVLEIGAGMLARGEDVDVSEGLPDYPEGDSPWRKVSR